MKFEITKLDLTHVEEFPVQSAETSGQYLRSDGVSAYWDDVNIPIVTSALSGLEDVEISNPTNVDYLKYDTDSGKWINSELIVTTALSALDDVQLTNPTSGQILTYTDGLWVNDDAPIEIIDSPDEPPNPVEGTLWLDSDEMVSPTTVVNNTYNTTIVSGGSSNLELISEVTVPANTTVTAISFLGSNTLSATPSRYKISGYLVNVAPYTSPQLIPNNESTTNACWSFLKFYSYPTAQYQIGGASWSTPQGGNGQSYLVSDLVNNYSFFTCEFVFVGNQWVSYNSLYGNLPDGSGTIQFHTVFYANFGATDITELNVYSGDPSLYFDAGSTIKIEKYTDLT